ncbi:MAG: DUF2075 domain-containing protein [Thermoguttaceae bacterium]|nr:DUF2075 domain-containing protein [Thermoguttaceae bacterium]
MKRFYYANSVSNFLVDTQESILGTLTSNSQFDVMNSQRDAWIRQIQILKRELAGFDSGTILFEYTIPRIGLRIDNVLLYNGHVFLLEFKVGEKEHKFGDKIQVTDYALDLKNFHKFSHDATIVPILVATEAPDSPINTGEMKPQIHNVVFCNGKVGNLYQRIRSISENLGTRELNHYDWIHSIYLPTPTIIEAAQVLYRGHNVSEISRNEASATNLGSTTQAIGKIIDECKAQHQKAICFITGVPGAGKTLAGLNIANSRHNFSEEEHAIFLSGNGPLVEVLQEALTRDQVSQTGIRKEEARNKAKAFIQIIHHFRDDALSTGTTPPCEKVAIFDEAQRAWDVHALSNFMKRKKNISDFSMSEPAFLIDIMDRHKDWAVIICLVGGGQEINTGEAGLVEWFRALRNQFPYWKIYVSDRITDEEYSHGQSLADLFQGLNTTIVPELHLAVSLRSFRSENVSAFVKYLLDGDWQKAKSFYQQFEKDYPIVLTRNLQKARQWVRKQANGSERFGLIASSNAKRLKPCGIWVENELKAPVWFLNDQNDIRSSYFLENVATEFAIQGLELDWTLLAWDTDMRIVNGTWECHAFRGTHWEKTNPIRAQYIKNAYRVLLTRARQGMVIFVPEGNPEDKTRKPEWYDQIYRHLKEILYEL